LESTAAGILVIDLDGELIPMERARFGVLPAALRIACP
jgi:diacylglycerol kinase family enzyme